MASPSNAFSRCTLRASPPSRSKAKAKSARPAFSTCASLWARPHVSISVRTSPLQVRRFPLNPGNPTEKIIPPVTRTVKAGSLVFKQGETAHEMCLVEEGELVAVTGDGLGGKELFRLGKGSLVGVAAVLDNEPNKHDIKAVVDSRLAIIGGAAIASLLKTAPIWFLAALKTLTSRTRLLREGFSKPLFADAPAARLGPPRIARAGRVRLPGQLPRVRPPRRGR